MKPVLPDQVITTLRRYLSGKASLILSSDKDFDLHTARWTVHQPPVFAACVIAANEEDVHMTILCAKSNKIPFMISTAGHGDYASMADIQGGIQINMKNFDKVEITEDGDYAIVGAGVVGKTLLRSLWDAGKVTVTDVSGVVGAGFWLGGGHGLLQGDFGLGADQVVAARVILGDGRVVKVSDTSYPELFWALRGAGHNFGVVTELKIKIYDRLPYETWTCEAHLFLGSQIEAVFETLKFMAANQRSTDHYVVVLKKVPEIDPDDVTVIVKVFSAGNENKTHLRSYRLPLYDIPVMAIKKGTFSYPEHSQVLEADEDFALAKKGATFMRHPLNIKTIDVEACRKCYDIFNKGIKDEPGLVESQVIFEGYPCHAVQAVPPESTAYPWREDRVRFCPILMYESNPNLDPTARAVGSEMKKVMQEGTDREEEHVYLNYANGKESIESLYGYEPWRLEKLRNLKAKYDPDHLFSYYGGIF